MANTTIIRDESDGKDFPWKVAIQEEGRLFIRVLATFADLYDARLFEKGVKEVYK